MTMAGHCPYLGLAGNRSQRFAVASPRHRCYLRHRPERIGTDYQAASCLKPAYRRCPRLTAEPENHGTTAMALQAAGQDMGWSPQPPQSGTARLRMEDGRPVEQILRARPAAPYTELKRAPSRRARRPRRSTSLTEVAVLSLGTAILLACSFVGYAIFYRSQVGPGMAAAPLLAEGPGPVSVEREPTLVPTFTPIPAEMEPTPAPTLMPTPVEMEPTQVPIPTPTPVTGLLTPIPEPTLPVLTASDRLPAGSPPTRLVIDRISLDIRVEPVGIKTVKQDGQSKQVWASLPSAGAFHQTSAYPGHPGNTVINGHRDIQGAIFRHLDRVEKGDEIILYVGEVAYPYFVTDLLVVPETFASAEQRAENLRLIGYMPEERLTLVTCTPVGLATHRLLVIAKPPEQAAPQMPEAGSDIQD